MTTLTRDDLVWRGLPYLAAAAGGVALAWLTAGGAGRLAFASVIGLGLIGVAGRRPTLTLSLLLAYLTVLGFLRRALIPVLGFPAQDALLLVGPGVVALLVLSLAFSGRLRLDTGLSKAVTALLVLMFLQVLNPRQGGLQVGIAGMLFYVVPLLWYWLGRTYLDERSLEWMLTRVVVPLAFLAAALGLHQLFVGFLPFEQAWIERGGYAALYVGRAPRPFSLFASAAEYAHYLQIGIGVCWTLALTRRDTRWLLAAVPLFVGLFLIGSRGPIVGLLLFLSVLWAMMGRTRAAWLPRLAVALAIGVVGLAWTLTQVSESDFENEQVGDLVAHQAGGLLDPTNKETSTAGMHTYMMVNGFVAGFRDPLGRGLGATSNAASKFGEGAKSSEVDLSDMMISLGLLGGVIYAVVIGLVLFYVVQTWHRTRSPVVLMIAAVVFMTAGQWLRGGEYSVVAVVWLCIGVLDRMQRPAES